MRAGIDDRETHRNHSEETCDAAKAGEIRADMKLDLIFTCFEHLAGQKRLIGAAVGVGVRGRDQMPVVVVMLHEFHPYPCGGPAGGRIENMCRESSHN